MPSKPTAAGLASAAGVGALAGLFGTVAMTISSTAEMKIRGREASNAPATAAGAVLGVKPTSERAAKRFGTIVHWGYGMSWGAVRGALDAFALSGPVATVAHLVLVWGAEQVVLPTTGAATPAWTWGAKEIEIDLMHHAVYVGATSVAYQVLAGRVDG